MNNIAIGCTLCNISSCHEVIFYNLVFHLNHVIILFSGNQADYSVIGLKRHRKYRYPTTTTTPSTLQSIHI